MPYNSNVHYFPICKRIVKKKKSSLLKEKNKKEAVLLLLQQELGTGRDSDMS